MPSTSWVVPLFGDRKPRQLIQEPLPTHSARFSPNGLPTLVTALRGLLYAQVDAYGPAVDLHSGLFGGVAPNPFHTLVHLLASMKDEGGKVLIEHFYDGIEPLSSLEQHALTEAASFDGQLKKELWLGWTEGGGRPLAELINLPSFNIRGLSSGRTEQASNVIPASATAAIDMRLVNLNPAVSRSRAGQDGAERQNFGANRGR